MDLIPPSRAYFHLDLPDVTGLAWLERVDTLMESDMGTYSGVVLDFYDDNGDSLKRVFPSVGSLPDIIKEANVRSREELPNEAFALVAMDGGHVLRKYACTDAGTTSMSVIYFLENCHKLPLEAVKTASSNLVDACLRHKIIPPPALTKRAGLINPDAIRSGMRSGIVEGVEQATSSLRGELASILAEAAKTIGLGAAVGAASGAASGALKGDALSGAGRGLIGGMAGGLMGKAIHPNAAIPAALTGGAVGGGMFGGPIDITGKKAETKTARALPRSDDDYAVVMGDGSRHYPIDSWDRIKTAERYWTDNCGRMDPTIRRQYAVKLASKAEVVGFPLSPIIKEVGSTTYAHPGHIKASLEMRKLSFDRGSYEDVFLNDLFEKRAEMPPSVFAETLRRFDIQEGLDRLYGRHIEDPYASTFGSDKLASAAYWEDGTDRVTESQLRNLAYNHQSGVERIFTNFVSREFSQDPLAIFDSMPIPQKRILARLANDMVSQGSTELDAASRSTF